MWSSGGIISDVDTGLMEIGVSLNPFDNIFDTEVRISFYKVFIDLTDEVVILKIVEGDDHSNTLGCLWVSDKLRMPLIIALRSIKSIGNVFSIIVVLGIICQLVQCACRENLNIKAGWNRTMCACISDIHSVRLTIGIALYDFMDDLWVHEWTIPSDFDTDIDIVLFKAAGYPIENIMLATP